jgi:hypothetical protein
MRNLSLHLVSVFAAAALLGGSPASAQESDFLARFDGSWSGGGLVQRNASENPNRVRCDMRGDSSATGVSISGTCRAAVVFSRRISADIRLDPATGRYSGTYVGSKVGPARLSGTRKGDAVNLTITWPKPVNGDTKARMTIRNDGNGDLRIVVTDEAEPGGPSAEVTDLALRQS